MVCALEREKDKKKNRSKKKRLLILKLREILETEIFFAPGSLSIKLRDDY